MALTEQELDQIMARRHRPVVAAADVERLVGELHAIGGDRIEDEALPAEAELDEGEHRLIGREVAGALYVFAAWLTCRSEAVTFGYDHEAATAAELVDAFCRANDLPAPEERFHEQWKHPEEDIETGTGAHIQFENGRMIHLCDHLPDPIDPETVDVEAIARVAHETNRAYCATLGDDSQPAWEDAPDWQRESAIKGVLFHLANPGAGPEASHESWLAEKEAGGWVYGEVKDPEADPPTHPCKVPFEDLPPEQQHKDHLFRGVVHAMVGWTHEPEPRYFDPTDVLDDETVQLAEDLGFVKVTEAIEAPAVDFASDAARKLAIAEKLTTADFKDRKATGATGYKVEDVEAIVKEREAQA